MRVEFTRATDGVDRPLNWIRDNESCEEMVEKGNGEEGCEEFYGQNEGTIPERPHGVYYHLGEVKSTF